MLQDYAVFRSAHAAAILFPGAPAVWPLRRLYKHAGLSPHPIFCLLDCHHYAYVLDPFPAADIYNPATQ